MNNSQIHVEYIKTTSNIFKYECLLGSYFPKLNSKTSFKTKSRKRYFIICVRRIDRNKEMKENSNRKQSLPSKWKCSFFATETS